MSTAAFEPVSTKSAMSSRAKYLSFLKCQPRTYTPWREPMSERQINSYFERQILPELSVLLEGSFQDLPDFDREEAVQDSVCQALEAYDQAKNASVIAVAEGVTDVWKIGTWGMALFGKSMSDHQCQLLCRAGEATGAWIVLLGDASTEKDDAASAWRKNYNMLFQYYKYRERVRLYLFEKGDPGDYTTQELSDLVERVLHNPNAV